ncbi:MAG: hypothetical protein SV760_07620 [Halobacteria archaeon]|nr:hypothetical protein [Halobacteria archaeon]
MEISGERECLECGSRWSYFDTREVACPDCGSLRSKSVSGTKGFDTASSGETGPEGSGRGGRREPRDERAGSEEGAGTKDEGDPLNLSDLVPELGADFEGALSEIEERCRSYTSRHGFVRGGELRPPEPRYVMACELKHAADILGREGATEDEREYVVDLIHGLNAGDPPDPSRRPESLEAAHNLAVAETVTEYALDLSKYARATDADVPGEVEVAREKAKRTEATEGEEDDAVEGLRLLRDAYEELVR